MYLQYVGNRTAVHCKGRRPCFQRAGNDGAVNYEGGQACFKERATKSLQVIRAGEGGQVCPKGRAIKALRMPRALRAASHAVRNLSSFRFSAARRACPRRCPFASAMAMARRRQTEGTNNFMALELQNT